MDAIDARFEKLNQIVAEFDELHATIVTEADTRLKVIDRVLADALGWPLASTQVEERAGEGYIDYCLNVSGASRLIVEAKRNAQSFALENRQSGQAFKLDGVVFNAAAKEAIRQAITYNAFKNAELACVTNGSEWIIFRGNRLGDGRNTLDGKGFVFSSLRAVADNFRVFHDLMAEDAVRDLRFRALFGALPSLQ